MSPYDKEWVTDRLKIYKINYTEVYNEVYDHMLSAIAAKRAEGDTRPILHLFQETIDQDFGSHQGLAEMTKERVNWVSGMLRESLKAEIGSHFNSINMLWTIGIFLSVYGMYVALVIPVKYTILPLFFLCIALPVFFYLSGLPNPYLRRIGPKRKRSVVREQMTILTQNTVIAFNVLMFVAPTAYQMIAGGEHWDHVRNAIAFMGYGGMAGLITMGFVYVKSVVKVARKDYVIMLKDKEIQ